MAAAAAGIGVAIFCAGWLWAVLSWLGDGPARHVMAGVAAMVLGWVVLLAACIAWAAGW